MVKKILLNLLFMISIILLVKMINYMYYQHFLSNLYINNLYYFQIS